MTVSIVDVVDLAKDPSAMKGLAMSTTKLLLPMMFLSIARVAVAACLIDALAGIVAADEAGKATSASSRTDAPFTFACDFDEGFCMGSRHCSGEHDCETENLVLVPDPAGRPGLSLMSKLWKTDERAEVRSNPNYQPSIVDENHKPEAWYAIKYFFPSSYNWAYGNHDCPSEGRAEDRGNRTIIWQLNSYPMQNLRPCQGVGSHFVQCKDHLYFEFQRSDGEGGTRCTKHSLGDIKTDRWVELVLHARWSGDEDGQIQVWYDGDLVLEQGDVRTYWHNEGEAPKNKFGLYYGDPWTKVDAPDEKFLYIDDVRIKDGASSFKEMSSDIR